MTAPTSPSRASPAAAPELASLRVLLVHEWLYTWAGAERVLEQLVALMPHADVLAGIVTPEMRREHPIAARAMESWVGHLPGARRKHRWFLPLHALAFSRFDTRPYDLVVSISHAFEKAVRARKAGAAHVSYCLSPPRFLWDLHDEHARLASAPQRIALGAAAGALRRLDRRFARRVDRFVSLSRHVADRVKRWYGRDSAVVYPPVRAKSPVAATSERMAPPYLLSIGRLVPYKRVDLAVQAADRLGVRLVVAGEGPQRRALERLAGPGTEFVGTVSEARAAELLSGCAAFVFCAEEDFGIAPLEANAHGAPVVAFGRGAARETMIDGETGVLFTEQTVDGVEVAIRRALDRRWDPAALAHNAARFSPERFREGMRRELLGAVEHARV